MNGRARSLLEVIRKRVMASNAILENNKWEGTSLLDLRSTATNSNELGQHIDCDCTYQRIHESMRDAFVLVDMQGHLLKWNPAYGEMLGYSDAELEHLTYVDLTPERWREAEATIVAEQVIPHGQSRLYEKEYRRKDGALLSVELKTHLLRDAQGRPEAMWAIVRDVSERKRIEAVVREQEEFFRLVAENSGDFIAVLDLEGRRLYNSPSYAHFFGDTKLLLGTNSFNEIHPDDQDRVRDVFRETVKTGIGQRLEFRFVLPDGAIRWMESRGGVIRDAAGRIARVVVVSNDITNRKAAEEQIHRLAYFDPLTMLPNRRLLIDRLRLIMATTRRNSRYGALLFLDLDNFKPVNDAHGHGVGDLLLVEAAGRLTKCVREVDTVARFGGDEFVVLLGDLDATKTESESSAFLVAEKIRNRMSEPFVLPVHHQGEEDHLIRHQCTSSIGVVLFLDGEYSEEDILRWADIAMYQAKENGRNQVCLIDPHTGNTISAPQ